MADDDNASLIRLLMQPQSFSSSPGIQPNLEDPNEIAAARLRSMGGGQGYRGNYTPDQQKQQAENVVGAASMVVPGLGAANEASKGNYGEAAKQAATSAVPFGLAKLGSLAKPALAGWFGSSAIAPTATAEETRFPFIEDNSTRKALDTQIKGLRVKDDRGKFDPQATEAARQKLINEQRSVWQTNQEKSKSLSGFEDVVRDQVKGLTPEQSQQYQSLKDPDPNTEIQKKRDYLQGVSQKAEEENKGFGQKYPSANMALQAAGAAAGIGLPLHAMARRADRIGKASNEAEAAFLASAKARAPKDATARAALAANKLDEYKKLNALDIGEFAGAPIAPYAIGTIIPNAIDANRLQNTPDNPAYKHAEGMLHPWKSQEGMDALNRSLMEGAAATGLGYVGGRGLTHFGDIKAGANASLKSIRDAQAVAAALKDARSRSRTAVPSLPMRPNPVTGKVEGDVYQGRSPFQLK